MDVHVQVRLSGSALLRHQNGSCCQSNSSCCHWGRSSTNVKCGGRHSPLRSARRWTGYFYPDCVDVVAELPQRAGDIWRVPSCTIRGDKRAVAANLPVIGRQAARRPADDTRGTDGRVDVDAGGGTSPLWWSLKISPVHDFRPSKSHQLHMCEYRVCSRWDSCGGGEERK